MSRLLLNASLLLCITFCSFAQTDSVFLKNQRDPVLGTAVVHYKKNTVSIKNATAGGRRDLSFDEITSIKLGNGKYYVSQIVNSTPKLLILLVEGAYSLLYQETDKLFYVKKSDSLLVISQAHIKRALPLIYGRELMDRYYIKSNIQPRYSAGYLKNLTSYANEATGKSQTIYIENIRSFKRYVHIGPYVAYGINSTAFDLIAPNKGGRLTYEKTQTTKTGSIPFGMRINVDLFPQISVDLGIYGNRINTENVLIDSLDTYLIQFPHSVLIPEKFDTDVKLRGYSFKTFHFDLSVNYSPIRQSRSRIHPYLFAGPSIVSMKESELILSGGFRDGNPVQETRITRWYRSTEKQYMIGFNGGLGVKYDLGKRFNFSIAGKYARGIFPKIHGKATPVKEQNNTPRPSSNFGGFSSRFGNRYDQYFRLFSVSASVMFRL
jgi:hypothetical protein